MNRIAFIQGAWCVRVSRIQMGSLKNNILFCVDSKVRGGEDKLLYMCI